MSSLLLNSLPVNYHPYNFAINMFIQHIMQSISASLVALSFALGCTVHSAGLLASFKVGNSFLFVRHLPSRSCQRWKVARRTRLLWSSFHDQNSRTGLFLGYVHDQNSRNGFCWFTSMTKTLKPDYFWFTCMTKTQEPDFFWFMSMNKTREPDNFLFTSMTKTVKPDFFGLCP